MQMAELKSDEDVVEDVVDGGVSIIIVKKT